MKYSFRVKNRIVVGNRKDCDFYVKYTKPIYIYPTGIRNIHQQKLLVNGIEVKTDCYCNIGDYIQINDFTLRFKKDCIQSNYKSGKLYLYEYDELQYDDFTPIVFDFSLKSKKVKIDSFNEKIEKQSFIQQWISTFVNLGLSIVMLYFIKNGVYMFLMILSNVILVFVQYILLKVKEKKLSKQYLIRKKAYSNYLFEIQKDLNQYFKKVKKYELSFLLNHHINLFSRKRKSSDYFCVDLGEKKQDLVSFDYLYQEEFPEIRQMVEYYLDLKIINCIAFNKKTRIQYNRKLLDTIIAKLIYFHSSEELKIKLIGDFDYTGIHFQKINISQIEENEDLYVFDRYYKEVEHLNLFCIVLSDENYDFYDELLVEKENSVYIESKDIEVNLEVVDFKSINQFVNKFELRKIENVAINYDLFDVHKELMWNKYDTKNQILAYINPDCVIDFHEFKDGPHALIAGMTGSGKSEWIQSLLLSLCILYSPDQINIIVIDYKGSSFASKIDSLPHVIGVIDNLNEDLDRCIKIIKLELKRRQVYFQEKGYAHINDSNLSHLFIICDEFAELKKERSDFVDELVSISRIGRSLGIHLILATQKPSGIVSEEILNNSNLKVALKLLDRMESMQLVGSEDALYLNSSGEFILKSNISYYQGKAMYVNKIAAIESKNRIVVNQKRIINDHQYFNYTQREYFISKMSKRNKNIFRVLPIVQSECFLMIDDLTDFRKEDFSGKNTVVYGSSKSGKTKTLESIIARIKDGVVYYIYEDTPLIYKKVISISIYDYEKIKRLFYRLDYKYTDKIYIVIDHFDLFSSFDFYEKIESLIKSSFKNSLVFILSMYQELNYFLQIYFSEKYVLYYDLSKRNELNQSFSFYNKKIEGRAWVKDKQAQIGINLELIDYPISEKYQLDFRESVWKENQYGFEYYSLSPFVLEDEVKLIYHNKDKLEHYVHNLKLCNYKFVYIKDISLYEINQIEHKIFLDEYSITMNGDYISEIKEDEVLYVGIRKKVKLKI